MSVQPSLNPLLGRFVTRSVPAPASGLISAGLESAKRVQVLAGGSVGEALAAALSARGLPASAAAQLDPAADAVIFLGGLVAPDAEDALLAVNRAAFDVAHAIAARFTTEGGTFITVQDTGGDLGSAGSSRAFSGGLAGLIKTAAQEWPKATCRAIDLERAGRSDAALAEALTNELLSGGAEVEVGLKATGERTTLISVRESAQTERLVLGKGDVVVVSGGGRGVTAATVIALGKASQASFALLGRTALKGEPPAAAGALDEGALKRALAAAAIAAGQKPSPAVLGKEASRILAEREVRATLAALHQAGCKAEYVVADVADFDGIATALNNVRATLGPIKAVIHGAGVLADRWIADKTPEQFHFVFDTKVNGLRALLAATAQDPLRAFICFSSVAARTGNQGQVDYAMANEVLNKSMAQLRTSRGLLTRSLGWGPWEGGMVTPQLKARFEQLGVPLIPLDVGAQMLVDELMGGTADVDVVLGGEPRPEALLAEAGAKQTRSAMHVSQASHAYLIDHAIEGTPVVPVVLAMEWMARAAAAARPELKVTAVRDVKVLSGIRLEHFASTGDWLFLQTTELPGTSGVQLEVKLVGAKGRPHYAAIVDLAETAPIAATPRPGATLEPWKDAVYDGHLLFHGALFQVITAMEGISDDGIAAKLTGTFDAGWVQEAWITDPAALDGGLQLALLWSKRVLGGATLPTAVGALRTYARPAGGPIRCVARGRVQSPSRALTDLVFLDAKGGVLAALEGVETHLRPGETPRPALA